MASSTIVMPQRSLLTPGGVVPTQAPLVDAPAESRNAFKKIGAYLDGIGIAYNDILVLKYIPEKIGSLATSAPTQNEQRWQNKCGLVLKFGPTSKADGFKYNVGDWVYYRPSDGQEIGIKCENDSRIALCLILSPAHIIGQVSNPDLIW